MKEHNMNIKVCHAEPRRGWFGRPIPLPDQLMRLSNQSGLVRLSEAAVACSSRAPGALATLRAPTRGNVTQSSLRYKAMYLAHVGLGVSLTATGLGLGRDRTTVRHGCSLVEERRVCPAEDQALAALEWGLRAQALALLSSTAEAGEAVHV
jgi:hypothetical protein